MIFKPQLARAVAAGRKTATRRPVKGDQACRYRIGHDYSIQPGRTKPGICRVKILDVQHQRAGDLTLADARAEGFRTTADFKAYWTRLYDSAWIDRHKVDLADALDLGVVSFILCKRFDEQHADTPVWAITFEVQRDEPHYLASQLDILTGRSDAGEYTTNRSRAIDEAEVIDKPTQERYTRAAQKHAEYFYRDLEAERARRRDERARSMRLAA